MKGFKRTINWNEYKSKITNQVQNRYLDFLIDPSFQRLNRLFVLSFENEDDRKSYNRFFLLTVEIKGCNFMTVGRNFFDQPIKNNLKTYHNIREFTTGQGDNYTNWWFTRLPIFQRTSQANSNGFTQTAST